MHVRARHAGLDPIRGLGWGASVIIALLVAPLPLFLLGLRWPDGTSHERLAAELLAQYIVAVSLGAIGVAAVAVPGLVLLRRARRDDLKARLLLGIGAGLLAVTCGLWFESGDGNPLDGLHALWPTPLYAALAFGLVGAFAHWHLTRWLPGHRDQVSR